MPSTIRVLVATGIAALLCVAAVPLSAQHEHHAEPGPSARAGLSGTVLCEEGPPLVGAIVQLLHEAGAERHVMATALTDASGRFLVRSAPGTYTLRVSYLGHAAHEQQVRLGTAAQNVGSMRMQPAALQLAAIAVAAERERVQLRSGATIVDVKTSTAAGGSVIDVLRTVPGLELEPDGRLSIRGSTSVLVLMNGRRLPLTDDALAAFLRQMPASALERVEAGTSASARQDADGLGGVVNLVFRDEAVGRTDMRSVATSIATEDHYMASMSAAGTLGAAAGWDASYSWSAMRPATTSWTHRESLLPHDPLRTSEQDSRARAQHRLHSMMAGTTVHPTATTSVGARGAYSWMRGAFRNTTDFLLESQDDVRDSRTTFSLLDHIIPAGEAALVLEWRPHSAGQPTLALEGRSSFVREDFSGSYAYDTGVPFLATTMNSRQREHVLQSDLSFSTGGTSFEIGQKLQLRNLSADFMAERSHHTDAHQFTYEDQVIAAYASAHRRVGSVLVQAGVRAEAERITLQLEDGGTTSDVRIFPSLLVRWPDHGRAVQYRASYSRRLQRPDASMLNPFSMGEDDMNSIVGNPRLRAEVSDLLEFGVERNWRNAALQVTPFLRRTNDPIRPLKTVSGSGQATTTLQNLSRTLAAGTDASIRGRISEATTLTLSGSVYHMSIDGAAYRNDGVYASARGGVDYRLTQRTLLQGFAQRRSTQAVEQGEILPVTTAELAITQRLGAGDRGRLTFRISDPFRSDRLAFRIGDTDFIQQSSRRISRPLASLFFSWAVGGEPREDAPLMKERPPQIF